jgi:hypothetical protein
MEIQIDQDVKAVAEFMQRTMPAAKLVGVAEAIAALSPLLWGRHGTEDVSALRLRETPITALPYDQHKQAAASESGLAA